jgi:hypothetical protein
MVASPFIPAATGRWLKLGLQPKGYAAFLIYTLFDRTSFEDRIHKQLDSIYKFLHETKVIDIDKAPAGAIDDTVRARWLRKRALHCLWAASRLRVSRKRRNEGRSSPPIKACPGLDPGQGAGSKE